MKLEEMLRSFPSREEIASAVGLEVRPSDTASTLASFGLFGSGIIVGAGLALLFAPKVGTELRHAIADKVGAVADQLRAQMPTNGAATSESACESTQARTT